MQNSWIDPLRPMNDDDANDLPVGPLESARNRRAIYVICGKLCTFFCIVVYLRWYAETAAWATLDRMARESRSEHLNSHMKEFRESLMHQSTHTLDTLDLIAYSHTNEEEDSFHPFSSVAVLIPPKMNPAFPACFVRKIGSIVNTAYDAEYPQEVKELNLNTFRNSADITRIHEDLVKYFDSEGRVVMVHDAHKLDKAKYIYLFDAIHHYSKINDKRMTLIFLLPLPENVHEEFQCQHKAEYKIMDIILSRTWSEVLPKEVLSGEIASIAESVILLNEGDRC